MRKVLAFLAFTILFNGCDSPTNPTESRVEIFTENGKTYTLQLTTRQNELQNFTSDQQAETAQNELRKKDTIELNETLWQNLKHAVDPFTISVLDEKGRVKIGTEMLEFQKDQVLKHTPNGTEVELFYGADGKEVERELNAFVNAIGNETEMEKLSFKNHFITKKVKTAKTSSDGCIYNQSDPNFDCRQSEPITVSLPDNQISGATSYSVRFHVWNQTIGTSVLTRRGYAGTQAQANIGGSWYGFGHSNVPSGLGARIRLYAKVLTGNASDYWNENQCSASISTPQYPNNDFPYAIPYDYFITNSCLDVSTDKKRASGYNTKSRHSGWVVDYFTYTPLWPYMNYNRVEQNPQIVNNVENELASSPVGNGETGAYVNLVNYGLY